MTPSSKAQAASSMSMPARQRQRNLEQEGGLVDIRMPLLVCLIYIPCVFLLLMLISIVALQFQPTVGLKDEDETTTKDPRTGQTIGGGREHNDLMMGISQQLLMMIKFCHCRLMKTLLILDNRLGKYNHQRILNMARI
ncbi:hypothetical protein AAC387_Pa04g0494 [Persea americana]